MKRTIKLSLAAILAVAAFVSCNKEQAISQSEIKVDGMRTVRIYSDVPSPTKTTLGENDQPLWVENDEISIFDSPTTAAAKAFVIPDEIDKKSGTILLHGEIKGAFSAVYPNNAFVSSVKPSSYKDLTDTVFVANVNIYKDIDGTFGKANIAVGKSNEELTSVQFKNAVALLEVTGLPVAGTLSLSKYKTALVDVSISKSADTLVTCAAEKPETMAEGDFHPVVSFNVVDNGRYYIPVFPGTKTEELELTFTSTAGEAQVMNLKTGVTLKRNVIYPVSWRTKKVTVQTYEEVNTALMNEDTYNDADDIPVQVEMTMNDKEDGKNEIIFPTQADNKAISIALSGTPETPIAIKNDTEASGPATLIISAPQGTELNINTPNTHVVLNGETYPSVTSISSDNTLVISQGVTVNSLTLVKGGLEVHGTLNDVQVTGSTSEVFVRDCEGLSDVVYNKLKPFIATGYKGVEKTDDNDIVPSEGVAKIGNVAYASLEEAIKDVKDNETITLLTNVTDAVGISVPSGKNFTVDFGDHTYTCVSDPAGSTNTKNQVFQLLQNSTITFKNGTINVAESAKAQFRFIIQNYANLTLEDITLDGTNLAITDKDRYTISNNCGTVEFKGKTDIIAASERGIAFDVCKYGKYDAPKVTWSSSGSVDGEIELTGGEFILGHNLEVNQPVRVKAAATLNLGTYTLSGSSDFSKKGRGVVIVNRVGDLTINGTTGVIDGATNQVSAAVVLTEPETWDQTTKLNELAKLTVNGGTLKGYYYGIVGNGKRHNTEITVNGGTITGTCNTEEFGNGGIYHPQEGKLTITGGKITGLDYAVEVRSGTQVNISGGEFTSTAKAYSCVKNGNGTTTTGAALAIAQHTTKNPISVTISGGTFTGPRAVALEDIEGNKDGNNVNVNISGGTYTATEYAVFNNYAGTTINISGGSFESTGSEGIAVYARLGSVNITGGEFINNSNREATLHVGCPEAVTKELQPKLTISGNQLPVGGGSTTAAKTIVKNLAEGKYSYNSGLDPLVVNMANELEYKAVTIENGWFYGQKPEKDDSYTGTDANNPKWFLDEKRTASWEDNHWEIGVSGTPNSPIFGD